VCCLPYFDACANRHTLSGAALLYGNSVLYFEEQQQSEGGVATRPRGADICLRCAAPMTIIAFITEVASTQRILEHIGKPTAPPPISPPNQCLRERGFYYSLQWKPHGRGVG